MVQPCKAVDNLSPLLWAAWVKPEAICTFAPKLAAVELRSLVLVVDPAQVVRVQNCAFHLFARCVRDLMHRLCSTMVYFS